MITNRNYTTKTRHVLCSLRRVKFVIDIYQRFYYMYNNAIFNVFIFYSNDYYKYVTI